MFCESVWSYSVEIRVPLLYIFKISKTEPQVVFFDLKHVSIVSNLLKLYLMKNFLHISMLNEYSSVCELYKEPKLILQNLFEVFGISLNECNKYKGLPSWLDTIKLSLLNNEFVSDYK